MSNQRHYIEFTTHAPGLERAEFEAIADRVADHLVGATGVVDPDLGVDLERRELTFCMTVEAPTIDDELQRVRAVARATLHAAGASTEGWERVDYLVSDHVEQGRLLAL